MRLRGAGQEMSCTSRGKFPASFEEDIDAMVDGVENAAEYVEQAIDDATRYPPPKADCELSDKERSAAMGLFWLLVREQGGNIAGTAPAVYEDAAMARCLQRVCLIDADGASAAASASSTSMAVDPQENVDVDAPLVQTMLRRLHAFPVGHWLKADPGRRGYTAGEWVFW